MNLQDSSRLQEYIYPDAGLALVVLQAQISRTKTVAP